MTDNLDLYKHYKVLGCTSTSSYANLKEAYKKLALIYHPDKKTRNNEEDCTKFLEVNEAWQILSNSELRKKYDAECRQAELESENALIYDRINLADMKNEEDEILSYPCRCGNDYLINKNDVSEFDIMEIPCQECTFSLVVEK